MDAVLLIITLVSLLAALTMSVVTWQVVRDDRRRSAARVAEIASELGHTRRPAEPAVPSPFASAASTDAGHDAMPTTPVADLFALAERVPVRWHPIGVALLGGLVVLGIALTGASLLRDSGGSNVVAPVAASPPPLELVTLRHVHEGDALTVSGLVRNPSTGSTMQRVMAVVFMFDRQGDFAGSGRAPLELATLAPGEKRRS